MIDGEDKDELLLETEVEEQSEQQAAETEGQAEDEDELIVSFGDEGEEQPTDSDLVRHLRQQLRERDKRDAPKATVEPVDPGPEPTMESCDYDEDAFKAKWRKWNEDSAKAKSAETVAEENRRKSNEAWQQQLVTHYEKATKLPVKLDAYEAAEQNIVSTLSIEQQSAIIRYSKDSAKLILALDRQPAQLAELAKTLDAGALVYKIAELDGKLKMTTKRKGPPPEEHVRGSASLENIGTDKRLEQLEKDAAKTGDRSKVIAYKRSLKHKTA